MEVPFSNLLAQYESIKEEIDKAIQSTIQTSSFIGGESIDQFELLFKELIGTDYCISCANGTDALYIAMRGLGLDKGGEVITTAHSWFSTSEAITQAGGTPIFCDTDEHYFCIDENLITQKITEKTVGIVPVHLYGHPAQMDKIMKIASEHNLWVVEDCAQAHLSQINNQNVGTFGDAATFSFYPGKNLGAMGDAGAIVTNNSELAKWSALFARHGGKGKHVIEGINSRMDALQASILNIKIPCLTRWTSKRISAAKYYSDNLQDIPGLSTPLTSNNCRHVFHLYTLLCKNRNALRSFLSDNNISTNINYPIALPFLPPYAHHFYTKKDFPVAYVNQQNILSIPIFPEISRLEQDYVINTIRKFYDC